MGFTSESVEAMFEYAKTVNPAVKQDWLETVLSGASQARRDFDVVRLAWDGERWPFNVQQFGEDLLGNPTQHFRLARNKEGWTKPYLNYLLCLSALSQHVDEPPKSFLEIGGGFGVLGEILLKRDPDARYVDLDIPPLVTVSSFYLRSLFGERVSIHDPSSPSGPIDVEKSAVLPNWRIREVSGPFDVFVNSFSFQEMEPDVLEHYVAQVADKDVEFVVSLNSKRGKQKAGEGPAAGVVEPVTSGMIIDEFGRHGYTLLKAYRGPLINSAGELAVLRKAAESAPTSRQGWRRR